MNEKDNPLQNFLRYLVFNMDALINLEKEKNPKINISSLERIKEEIEDAQRWFLKYEKNNETYSNSN